MLSERGAAGPQTSLSDTTDFEDTDLDTGPVV